MKQVTTLCFAERPGEILLGYKKRGFGAGRWNGFGGKVRDGETIEAAMMREMLEECGIVVGTSEKAGVLTFTFDGDELEIEMHIYRAIEFLLEPRETEEMRPQWFRADAIPFNEMWPDDQYWFPHFLARKLFCGRFHFRKKVMNQAAGSDSILHSSLDVVGAL